VTAGQPSTAAMRPHAPADRVEVGPLHGETLKGAPGDDQPSAGVDELDHPARRLASEMRQRARGRDERHAD
jgi:hypothetical protein